MKKKFAGLLAASLAMVLTLGMTVSAAPSVSTTDPSITQDVLIDQAVEVFEAIDSAGGIEISGASAEGLAYDLWPVSVTDFDSAMAQKDALVKDAVSGTSSKYVTSFDLDILVEATGEKADLGTVTLGIPVPGVRAEGTYVILHMKADGTWEAIPTTAENGKLTATFTSLSPIVVVEVLEKDSDDGDDDDDNVTESGAPASPKTGETLPVAGVMTLICLAGAAVCAKRVRRI